LRIRIEFSFQQLATGSAVASSVREETVPGRAELCTSPPRRFGGNVWRILQSKPRTHDSRHGRQDLIGLSVTTAADSLKNNTGTFDFPVLPDGSVTIKGQVKDTTKYYPPWAFIETLLRNAAIEIVAGAKRPRS